MELLINQYFLAFLYLSLLLYYPNFNKSYYNLVDDCLLLNNYIIIPFIISFLLTNDILKLIILSSILIILFSLIKQILLNYNFINLSENKEIKKNKKKYNSNKDQKNKKIIIDNDINEKKKYLEFASDFINNLEKKKENIII